MKVQKYSSTTYTGRPLYETAETAFHIPDDSYTEISVSMSCIPNDLVL